MQCKPLILFSSSVVSCKLLAQFTTQPLATITITNFHLNKYLTCCADPNNQWWLLSILHNSKQPVSLYTSSSHYSYNKIYPSPSWTEFQSSLRFIRTIPQPISIVTISLTTDPLLPIHFIYDNSSLNLLNSINIYNFIDL